MSGERDAKAAAVARDADEGGHIDEATALAPRRDWTDRLVELSLLGMQGLTIVAIAAAGYAVWRVGNRAFGRPEPIEAAYVWLLTAAAARGWLRHPLVKVGRSEGTRTHPAIGHRHLTGPYRAGFGMPPVGEWLLLAGWTPTRALPSALRPDRWPATAVAVLGGTAVWRGVEVLGAWAAAVAYAYVATTAAAAEVARQPLLDKVRKLLLPSLVLSVATVRSAWPFAVAVAVLLPLAWVVRRSAWRTWFAAESLRWIDAIALADRPSDTAVSGPHGGDQTRVFSLPRPEPYGERLLAWLRLSLWATAIPAAMQAIFAGGDDIAGVLIGAMTLAVVCLSFANVLWSMKLRKRWRWPVFDALFPFVTFGLGVAVLTLLPADWIAPALGVLTFAALALYDWRMPSERMRLAVAGQAATSDGALPTQEEPASAVDGVDDLDDDVENHLDRENIDLSPSATSKLPTRRQQRWQAILTVLPVGIVGESFRLVAANVIGPNDDPLVIEAIFAIVGALCGLAMLSFADLFSKSGDPIADGWRLRAGWIARPGRRDPLGSLTPNVWQLLIAALLAIYAATLAPVAGWSAMVVALGSIWFQADHWFRTWAYRSPAVAAVRSWGQAIAGLVAMLGLLTHHWQTPLALLVVATVALVLLRRRLVEADLTGMLARDLAGPTERERVDQLVARLGPPFATRYGVHHSEAAQPWQLPDPTPIRIRDHGPRVIWGLSFGLLLWAASGWLPANRESRALITLVAIAALAAVAASLAHRFDHPRVRRFERPFDNDLPAAEHWFSGLRLLIAICGGVAIGRFAPGSAAALWAILVAYATLVVLTFVRHTRRMSQLNVAR